MALKKDLTDLDLDLNLDELQVEEKLREELQEEDIREKEELLVEEELTEEEKIILVLVNLLQMLEEIAITEKHLIHV